MKLLAVETSTDACSAALSIDGELFERFELAPKEHTKLILPMIDSLMAEAKLRPHMLDALAFSRGPGSFTGVRISTGVIQGIALGTGLQVVPVSTLSALAQDFFDVHKHEEVAYVAMDARMGEIFWGVYRRGNDGYAELIGEEAVTPADLVEFPELVGTGIGSGWNIYPQELMTRLSGFITHYHADRLPRASAVARLGTSGFESGLAVSVELAMPVYLRDKVAKKESERQVSN
jgi:tRNA threonylcarbamoyladenosine biosynthesis protein TsaB